MATDYRIAIIINAKDQASKVLGGIGSSLQGLGKVALGVGAGAAAGLGAAGVALTKLAIDAAPLQGIEDAFRGIAKESEVSADEMLKALQKGSAGMVTQRELMMSYNSAAQLVGTTFANDLPKAMGYLGKVSAATGEDMGFMLDSLVTGVGRLSPLILDNLGIQVNLTEANQAYADSIGKSVDELTKQEQQTALMSQVMAKLEENTAAMPEVVGSAAQQVAELGTKFADLKDRVGMELLPLLQGLMDAFGQVVDLIMPLVIPAIEGLVAILQPLIWAVQSAISGFVQCTEAGGSLGEAVKAMAVYFGVALGASTEVRLKIGEITQTIIDLIGEAKKLVGEVIKWAAQFVSWKDVLIALGIAIATVVVPALASIVAAAAPVIAVGVALIALVALLRRAWEENFLGIRDIVEAVWKFIVDEVWPSLRDVFFMLKNDVIPPVREAFQELWNKATEFWNGFWGVFKPALEDMYTKLKEFWDEIQPKLVEAWAAIEDAWDTVVALYEDTLKPALDDLAEALGLGGGGAEDLGKKFGALVALLAEIQLEAILNAIVAAVEAFVTVVNAVAAAMEWWHNTIEAIKTSLDGLDLPDWLQPGSPAPLELALRGIANAMGDVNVAVGRSPLAVGAGSHSNVSYHLTVNTSAPYEPIVQDYEMMKSMTMVR